MRRRRKQEVAPTFDMTPMIDCVFQLLIFFIVCTRFIAPERFFDTNLPVNEGPLVEDQKLQEQVTIYCCWSPDSGTHHYEIGVSGRARRVVARSHVTMNELVIYPSDNVATVAAKRARYEEVCRELLLALKERIDTTPNTASLEICYAQDPRAGVRSGTAPWLFTSIAIDAASGINLNRDPADLRNKLNREIPPRAPQLPIKFKYADALRRQG